MEVKFLYNYGDEELFCIGCKQKILPYEKFAIVYEDYHYELIEKCYHIDCIPTIDEEPYIIPEE